MNDTTFVQQVEPTLELSAAVVEEVVNVLKEYAAVGKRFLRAADSLREAGVTSEMLQEDKAFRAMFQRDVILLSFTKTEQIIATKLPTLLSDAERVTRRWIQTEVGSRLAKVIKYVTRSEKNEQMTDEERGAQARSTLSSRLHKELVRWIDKIEKAEAVDFSATLMIAKLKEAISLIK